MLLRGWIRRRDRPAPCLKAQATLTRALPKIGLLSPGAAAVVGRLYVVNISVPPELYRRLGLEVGPLFEEDVIADYSN